MKEKQIKSKIDENLNKLRLINELNNYISASKVAKVASLLTLISSKSLIVKDINDKLQRLTLDDVLCGNDICTWINTRKESLSRIDYNSKIISRTKRNQNELTANLKVGNVFCFGIFNDSPVKWRIAFKQDNIVIAICTNILCKRVYTSNNSSSWIKSELRNWLNSEFFNMSFTKTEQEFIEKLDGDNVTILTKEYADKYLNKITKSIGESWWLRSNEGGYYAWGVSAYGHYNTYETDYF